MWYVRRETAQNGGQPVQSVDTTRVIFEKFPVFVLGFILMFALSSTGVFAPAQHYAGRYFDNKIKADKLLTDKDIGALKTEFGKAPREDQKKALQRLIDNKKVMSIDDDTVLRGLQNSGALSKDANAVLRKAHNAVYHTAKKIRAFRDWITWLFAFGLTGLGMQITVAAMRQAGGQPLVIGGVVGTAKAVFSLIVVLLFVRETI